jgi:hypothetical protein
MKLPAIPRLSDHGSEITLLGIIAVGVLVLMGIGHRYSLPDKPFDPSAYLVVLTLIVGAIKERWTQRSVDRMGQQLADSQPVEDKEKPSGNPDDPVTVQQAKKP